MEVARAARPLFLGRVLVHDRDALNRAVLADDVHGTPVGELRDDQLRDVLERRLVVERGREQRAHLREERELIARRPLPRVEPRVVDREGRARRQVLHQRQIPLAVVPKRLRPGERDRAHLFAAREQWQSDGGVRIERLDDLLMALVDHGFLEAALVEHLDDHGPAFAQRARRGLRRVPRRRIVLAQLFERPLLDLVGRGDPDTADLRAVDDVDDAPVRDLRHGETRDRREGRVVVQQLAEDAAGFGHEPHLTLLEQSLAVEERVVDGCRRAPGEVERDRQVRLAVAPSGFGRDERDRAECAPANDERHGHRAAQAEAAELGEHCGSIRESLVELCLRELRRDLGLLRPDHGGGASRSVGIDRQLRDQLLRAADLRRVLVGNGEPLDLALVADDVDHAPVGERRNDERRDVRERRLVVQRRRELLAGFGDQAAALGKPLLLLVHRGRPDRGGGEVRDCSSSAEVGVVEVPRPASVEDDRSDHFAPVA